MKLHSVLSISLLIAAISLLGVPWLSKALLAEEATTPATVSSADSELGTAFTYQGNLKKSGQPVNATCSFQFSLWGAPNGGTQVATTQTNNNVPVKAGAFAVQLDFGNQFQGDARWLQTAVKCAGEDGYTTLNPRQPLNAVPYAMGLRPGAVMASATPGDAFYVENRAADGNAVHGKATQGQGTGVLGESESWAGVWGESTEASGVVGMSAGQFASGVWGENTGDGYGVYGKSPNSAGVVGTSTDWIGVYGKSDNQTGVVGESTNHDGVRGSTTAPDHIGVKGVANAPGAVGVWGESAPNTGVYGTSSSGVGVWGETTSANTIAVKGVANAEGAVGVWGESAANTGIYGASASGIGVWGQTGGANTIAVKGVANAEGGVGVWGESAATTGVYGQSGATAGAALWGNNTAGGVAVRANGTAIQSRDKGGFVKAMLRVTRSGTISHCYNGINGASTGNCGVTITHTEEGRYDITFDFIVADRFIQVTPEFGSTGDGSIVMLLARIGVNSNRVVQVFSYHPPTEGGFWGHNLKDTGFWLTIY